MDLQHASDMKSFLPAIRQAQQNLMTAALRQSLLLNTFIATSVVLIVSIGRGPSLPVFLWLVVLLTSLALRDLSRSAIKRFSGHWFDNGVAVKLLTAGALSTGLAWAALPFCIPNFDGTGLDAVIYLIMVGISAGAAIRGFGCSSTALAFALPPQIAMIASLLRTLDGTAFVLALNVGAFVYVTLRSVTAAEGVFVSNEIAKLKATALAESLGQANDDIRLTNSRLEVLANGDPTTGLPNRTLFNTRLKSDIAAATERGETLSLLLIDLDRFKQINDTLGHSAGDMVLYEIGNRLRATVGGSGLIARLGGDEFAIIYLGSDAYDRALVAAAELLQRSRAPIMVGTTASVVGLSIGIATFPQQAQSAEALLACADMALYEAKANGRRQMREFDPELKARTDRQRRIEQDLEAAIHAGRIETWFQPQVALCSQKITGFEALLRWTHPQLGPIAPPEIVQAAQIMHLADTLTAHVAGAVCRLLNRLPALDLPEATVAINISPNEFAIYSVADVLELVTRRHGINPALLEVEITEEAILDTVSAGEQLKRLENAGYKLAVDDFGMGHSSLAYLIGLKIDRLKIDRSFVQKVSESRTNQGLIAALVGLGHALSLDIVVEGVETAEDAEVLRMLGCGIAQGYFFARPMAVEALEAWISAHTVSTDQMAVA